MRRSVRSARWRLNTDCSSIRHERKVEADDSLTLQDLQILPYELEDGNATAAVRAALTKRGTPIGPYDVMIAGTALRHGLVMVTSNGDEFERINGLILEDWRHE